MNTRRHFLTAGALSAIAGPLAASEPSAAKVSLKPGDVILFQGDSITDAGRDRKRQDQANDARMLGTGYPQHLAGALLLDHAKLGLRIYNRGISGNKVPQLADRWEADALALKPSILSILVGVNDIWHKLDGKYDGTPEAYRDGYAALLERTRQALPGVRLVVCEPFVLRCGAVNDRWFPEFDTRRVFAREVASKAGAIWVPFQSMFDKAVAAGTEPAYWAPDGVHPSPAGHALMARTWREQVGM